jgi:glycosyltransferase involved in cell wall biosynthesis
MAKISAQTNGTRSVRVLHLISELCDGGSTRWLQDIVRMSDRESFTHQVVTIYPDYEGDAIYADPLRASGVYDQPPQNPLMKLSRRIVKGIRAQRNRIPARKLLSLPLRLGANGLATWRVTKALMRFRPDVIHAHTLPEFIPGVIIRMIFRKPLIHTVPCLFSQMEDSDYDWMPRFYSWLHPWVDRFSTGEARSELLSVGVPASKIIYDLCGVDMESVNAVKAERERHHTAIRDRLGIPQQALIALSVGRLHSSKGHNFALEALPALLGRFPELHWVVLGEGDERHALEIRASELGVAERTHLIGYQDEPLPYFAAASIYLRTTIFEPENLSFYQAMAMGLPAVGFDTGWDSDLIRMVACGQIVPNGDVAALALATAQILALPDRGRSMGDLAASYAREHLDIQHSVSLLSSTYYELSNRSNKKL